MSPPGRKFPDGCAVLLLSACSGGSWRRKQPAPEIVEAPEEVGPVLTECSAAESHGPTGEQSLIDQMLLQSRYALLLRPQIIANLTSDELARSQLAFSEGMCLVPPGEVALHPLGNDEDGGTQNANRRSPLRVEAYYLDRYPVTNAQFQQFVASGGYEQIAIWDREIWPAVLDFVDQTGHPGPRFWRRGSPANGEANHPVVGVCWYEAWAYSRWVGKRLATDAEWVKAGSWPVSMAGHPLLERRYPWGDAMDRGPRESMGIGARTDGRRRPISPRRQRRRRATIDRKRLGVDGRRLHFRRRRGRCQHSSTAKD